MLSALSAALAIGQLAFSNVAYAQYRVTSGWTESGEMRKLADGFKGPADFCVMPQAGGLTVIVPDLVQSQLRFIQLRK